ncbi:hexaprenyl pyrophosphate synthetase protein, putative [Eimeria necatrix]|uniref:Hexaprenyl pyrophosphate synthetase protein, putative n=1 Tax=Eimeria necatrix TaxID=51315 RepID=U6MSW7_9EIME|nr:hexaprenyl pyrophosphate synthetase protein, putative [Eimeria necatrix]CDJ67312.1 hexaprenyl pyrophosphate synthetase protein, putative [Eimeria necatrix]
MKAAWEALKRRQIEKLLPALSLNPPLPSCVSLGTQVLQQQPAAAEALRRAADIEQQLQAATLGRNISSLSPSELKGLDWSLLDAARALNPEVSAVAKYLLQVPSKRFRPLLLLLLHRALQHCVPAQDRDSSSSKEVLPLIMVPVAELIHTATLMHDDVLDEAPTRRGRTSAPFAFGSKKAVLGGDFLLARASSIAATAGYPEVCFRVAQAVENLVTGELLQALTKTSDIAKAFEALLAKSYCKTGSLMAETCACLAVLGGYSRAWVRWSHDLGAAVGLAFQLLDDEADLLASAQTLGKPSNSDLRNGIATAPLLLAAQEHPQQLLPLLQRQLKGEGDPDLAAAKIREGAALPRARLLSRVYIHHVLQLLQQLPRETQQQQNAAADLAALLQWITQRSSK